MSMLAERRFKKKWILNPKKTQWTEDPNKFGQKMLEKMGWTPGKGLGINEQGMVNALRIKHKNDLKGLGCEEKYDDDWIKTQEEYNRLLGKLGRKSDSNEVNKVGEKSLENISKSVKNRVHYHKFTRGKDLSKYSAKDLDSILGVNSVLKTNLKARTAKENHKYANFTNSGLLKFAGSCQEIATDEIYIKKDVQSEKTEKKLKKTKKKKLKSDLPVMAEQELSLQIQKDECNDESYVPQKKKKRKKQ